MIVTFLIAGIVFLLTLWRREYGIAATILLWPAYLVRTTIAGIPTTALELSIYALVAGWLIRSSQQRKISWPHVPRKILVFSSIWAIAWLLATAFSQDRQASLGAVKAWLIDPLLFAFVTLAVIRSERQRRILYTAVVVSGTVVALAGLAQMVGWRDTLQDGRLSSFFHPVANYAAMYLGPILVLTIGWLLWKQLARGWWIAAAIIAAALILTVSFGGYLAVGIGLLLYWWRWPDRRMRGLAMMIAAVVLAVGMFALTKTPYLAEKITTSDRSSSLVRTQIWRTSVEMIKDHPIFGVGPNAFEPIYRATIPKLYWPPLEWLVSQPHQLYLALWLETGLLGLVTFLGLLVLWLRENWRRLRQGESTMIVPLAAMSAILAHGFVDTPLFKNDLSLLFVFIFLLSFLPSRLPNEEK